MDHREITLSNDVFIHGYGGFLALSQLWFALLKCRLNSRAEKKSVKTQASLMLANRVTVCQVGPKIVWSEGKRKTRFLITKSMR